MEVDCRTASHLFVGGNLASRCLPRDLFSLSPLGWDGAGKSCARGVEWLWISCRVIQVSRLSCAPRRECARSSSSFHLLNVLRMSFFLSWTWEGGQKGGLDSAEPNSCLLLLFFLNRPSAFISPPPLLLQCTADAWTRPHKMPARRVCTPKNKIKIEEKTRHRTLNNAHSKVLCCIFLSFSSYFYVSS